MARILVVDDSIVARKNIVGILTKAGHTVVGEAANGGQAHQMYMAHIPDLVTMDITMPVVNGIEAVKLIMRDYPNAKIVMVSALSQRNMVFEALENGAKHYLVKPITNDSVLGIVNKVLGVVQPAPTVAESVPVSLASAAPQPFTIESVNGLFKITITKYVTEESFKSLKLAVQGLLFIKPLKVALHFESAESIPVNFLANIGEIAAAIQGANGEVQVTNSASTASPDDIAQSAQVNTTGTSGASGASVSVGSAELFPAGHKQYSLESPGYSDTFVYSKSVQCPICDKNTDVKIIRYTKLALDKVDKDFRKRFIGFDPLWYSIQTCSNCGFASLTEDFAKVEEKAKQKIKEKLSKLSVQAAAAQPTINQVFASYYLSLHLVKGAVTDKMQEAKLWLRLAWLYEDVNEADLSKMAAENALVLYKDMYHNGRRQTTVEQDQRLTMLLGELSLRAGLKEEAHKYFRDTIVNKEGNKTMNEQARDRIQDIR